MFELWLAEWLKGQVSYTSDTLRAVQVVMECDRYCATGALSMSAPESWRLFWAYHYSFYGIDATLESIRAVRPFLAWICEGRRFDHCACRILEINDQYMQALQAERALTSEAQSFGPADGTLEEASEQSLFCLLMRHRKNLADDCSFRFTYGDWLFVGSEVLTDWYLLVVVMDMQSVFLAKQLLGGSSADVLACEFGRYGMIGYALWLARYDGIIHRLIGLLESGIGSSHRIHEIYQVPLVRVSVQGGSIDVVGSDGVRFDRCDG